MFESPFILSSFVALMVLGFAGIGLGELRADAANAGGDAAGPSARRQRLETRVRELDRELTTIAGLIQSHLEASGRYGDSLAQAGRNLPPAVDPEKVRAVVRRLIEANEQMQRETSELTERLEKSRSQVAALRSRLVEAQAIGMSDSLTSLGNRRSFDVNLAKHIGEARAQKTEMCLVLGDLDHFKKINDNFGHPFGDLVLKFFAELLTKHIKDSRFRGAVRRRGVRDHSAAHDARGGDAAHRADPRPPRGAAMDEFAQRPTFQQDNRVVRDRPAR